MRIMLPHTSSHDPDALVAHHIKLLHTYNEIKDGAQALIGKVRGWAEHLTQYAVMTRSTVTAVHNDLGLSLTE